MKASPLDRVKEEFGSKEDLVAAVKALATDELWLDRVSEDKGLERVSNKKLLKLHALLTEVKGSFGSRDKLIETICDLEKRPKDADYKTRLSRWPTPRLYDWYQALYRKAG
jgi:hypothetical protein